MAINAAIGFTNDTFGVGARALGRRVANTAFLRAAIAAREGPVVGCGYEDSHCAAFSELVHSIDASAEASWILGTDANTLGNRKVLHKLDPAIGPEVATRAWVGPGRYSITAVAHTVFDKHQHLSNLMREPVMPWDALICTSRSLRSVVESILEAEADYARWRYGGVANVQLPQLPVIPLGVHAADFAQTPASRGAARAALGISESEVVCLFVGRLSIESKAHPGQMYQGLQAARLSGAPLTLIECGWPKTDNDRQAFGTGPQVVAPNLRRLQVDGNDEHARLQAWRAADVFISLSDNIQETFGLTPLEAMAAGLPVIASDWDGYRDTVRDGVDGYLIPTWAPSPGAGRHLAFAFHGNTLTPDTYSWGAAASTSVNLDRLVQALHSIASDPERRITMGLAGQSRARAEFDWKAVYQRYQELWEELDGRRMSEGQGITAPRPGALLEPFSAYRSYPTHHISGETIVELRTGASLANFQRLQTHALFPSGVATSGVLLPLWHLLERVGPQSLDAAAEALGTPLGAVIMGAGLLTKMGFTSFSSPDVAKAQ